jgi:hypothetical protein
MDYRAGARPYQPGALRLQGDTRTPLTQQGTIADQTIAGTSK